MIYGKILVAYDGSDQAKGAVRTALELADHELAREVHVLKVVEPFLTAIPYDANTAILSANVMSTEIIDIEREEFESEISDLAQNDSVVPSTEIKLGSPIHTILEVAKERKVGLIVMGSRGLGPIRGLLGSVGYGVLSHANVPVLIVR